MAEEPFRNPPTTLSKLFAGRRVDIEVMGSCEKTIFIIGVFTEIIQDNGMSWIVLRDANCFSRSGLVWPTGELNGSGYEVKTDNITSAHTCVDLSKVICIGLEFNPKANKK